MKKPIVTAVLLSAGESCRMNCDTAKQLIKISGVSVVRRTALAFDSAESIENIIIVAREEEIPLIRAEIADLKKVRAVVVGGECRAESARLGFIAARDGADLVAIHDGARCLVTPEIINKVVYVAISTGAASAGAPVTDTVKKIDGDMNILSTVNRGELYFTATPQVFSTELYDRALRSYTGDLSLITDDNMLLESIGVKVRLVDCGKENIKITTAEDVRLAEFLIEKRLKNA